jgi:hypothetical protein
LWISIGLANLLFAPRASFPLAVATFPVTTTADSGPGSLRQAILDANANPGQDTIAFNIPGSGVHTISPTSAFPTVTDPVSIDGYTQPGSSPNTLVDGDNAVLLIELEGSNIGLFAGIVINSSNCSVRGLVINRFYGSGIFISSSVVPSTNTSNVVQGNFIGTDPTGTIPQKNNIGVSVSFSTNNLIGGTTPAARNVISGNGSQGIFVGTSASRNIIQGNFIGTNANGDAALSNNFGGVYCGGLGGDTIGGTVAGARNVIAGNLNQSGISVQGVGAPSFPGATIQGNFIGTDVTGSVALGNFFGIWLNFAPNNIIGGTVSGARNVISGNRSAAIYISGFDDSRNNQIQGNFIGTDLTGTRPLGNSGDGFRLEGAINSDIGGTSSGAGNIIAFNGGNGLFISGTGNAIRGNSIFSNQKLGIDLGNDGVTPNDTCDSDKGSNNRQNFPVLISATKDSSNTTIQTTLNSTANTQFRIEFFSNSVCDPSGYGQGKVFLGATNVTTDGLCNANTNFVVPNASVVGPYITATATDSNNNTSEFSACAQQTTTNAVFQFNAANYNVGEGDGSVTITVNRTVDTGGFSSIDFSTGNNEYRPCTPGDPLSLTGVATQNCDFIRNQGTLTFNSGDTSKTLSVLIVDDTHVEGPETFPVMLSTPVGGGVGVINAATVTIADNDTASSVLPTPKRFGATLTGGQETPPNNSNGSGQGYVLLNQSETSARASLQFANLGSAETAAHIHGPGGPGAMASILFPLPTANPVTDEQINPTLQQVADLKAGLHYMDVHSTNFSGGEIRGQLLGNPMLRPPSCCRLIGTFSVGTPIRAGSPFG